MAKNEVSQWSTTASENTDVGGIPLSDATSVRKLDDIEREHMAQIARWRDAPAFGGDTTIDGDLTVAGDATVNGALNVDSDLDVTGKTTTHGELQTNGILDVNGTAAFAQTATFSGSSAFNAPVSVNSTSTFAQTAVFNGALDANGSASFAQTVTLNSDLNVPIGEVDVGNVAPTVTDSNGVILSPGVSPLFYAKGASTVGDATAVMVYSRGVDGSNQGRKWIVQGDGDCRNDTGVFSTISSDERLKENIVDVSPQLSDMRAIRVRHFNYKAVPGADVPTHKMIGLIAQEVQPIKPGWVTEAESSHDPTVENPLTVAGGFTFYSLLKACQEGWDMVDALEARLASAEARLAAIEGAS